MTHRREPLSIESEGINALRQLTDEDIRAATGKTRGYFYQVFSPANSMGLQFEDAAALDAALLARGAEPRFKPLLKALRNAVIVRLGGRPPHRPEDIARRALSAAAKFGDIARVIEQISPEAMAGHALDAADVERLVQAEAALVAVLDALVKDARAGVAAQGEQGAGVVAPLVPRRGGRT